MVVEELAAVGRIRPKAPATTSWLLQRMAAISLQPLTTSAPLVRRRPIAPPSLPDTFDKRNDSFWSSPARFARCHYHLSESCPFGAILDE
jgi:hypothetical protein